MSTASPVLAQAADYAPMVGDRFHVAAGTYWNPMSGEVSPTPERTAVVTMMSHDHVVVVVDGVEGTMRHQDFARLAANTLKHGAVLTRANTEATGPKGPV